jgi:3',5'-cyclic AMP phosphodiesterase CpdA
VTRIAHLSDPHFGTEDPRLIAPLIDFLAQAKPDLVVISGDLTQRARRGQYAAAAAFLRRLPAPTVAVPGNHDAPLWNLPVRLMQPWAGWHRAIGPEMEHVVQTDALVLVALNTANPHVWKNGRITPAQSARIAARMANAGARRRVVAMHHPLEGPPKEPPSLAGAEPAAREMAAAGVEIVLSGHLHFTYAAPVSIAPSILSVQAGTCLSRRTRNDGNAFNLIDLIPDGVTLTHVRAQPDGSFLADADWTLTRTTDAWHGPGL